ncbi:DUF4440 domain-containing protein [Emcibacter nanhaiensis]|nr:nuclear transport factor 2 family protein [Emcibacter nanhaiensis]
MTDKNLTETLVALEHRLLEAGATACAATFAELLHDDFVEIGKSGRRFVKSDFPEALSGPAPAVSLSDPELRPVTDTLALLLYTTTVTGRDGHIASQARRSSLWQLTDGRWQMIFHQGTPAGIT